MVWAIARIILLTTVCDFLSTVARVCSIDGVAVWLDPPLRDPGSNSTRMIGPPRSNHPKVPWTPPWKNGPPFESKFAYYPWPRSPSLVWNPDPPFPAALNVLHHQHAEGRVWRLVIKLGTGKWEIGNAEMKKRGNNLEMVDYWYNIIILNQTVTAYTYKLSFPIPRL